jgi:hypothetical protein
VFGTVPLAFTGGTGLGAGPELGPRAFLMLIPVLAVAYIARTATVVDASGIRVRAVFGSRRLAWPDIRGLSVSERSVYAVCQDGALRLPCVRITDLAAVSRASGGHLPEVDEPTPKFAPSKRGRR